MYTTIGIFYLSLIGILLLIVLKRREVNGGRPSIVSLLGRGSDRFFHTIFNAVGNALSYVNRHTFAALGHWIAFHILLRIRKIYVDIKASFIAMPQGKKMLDAVRGRGEVKSHGASFYLRRISDR